MIDLERLETITLTNEELQTEIQRLTAHIGNLQVQISEYRDSGRAVSEIYRFSRQKVTASRLRLNITRS